MNKSLLVLLSTLLLFTFGCTAVRDGVFNYDQRFYELNGSSLNSVIAKMGLPDNQYELGNSKVYVWTNSRNITDPVFRRSSIHSCEVSMVISSTDIVMRVEVNGDREVCTPSKWYW